MDVQIPATGQEWFDGVARALRGPGDQLEQRGGGFSVDAPGYAPGMATIAERLVCPECRGEQDGCAACAPNGDRFSLLAALDDEGIEPSAFLARIDYQLLRRALGRIPAVTRMLVCLVDIAGLDRDRAEEMLALTRPQGRELLARGRLQLRRALWEEAQRSGVVDTLRDRRVRLQSVGTSSGRA